MSGKLYLTATPIGNYDDITIRALNTLKEVDFIVCEEYKEARRFISHYAIDKELISLNEHNESETVPEIIKKLKEGNSTALISDCGTPLFSDPGHVLVDACVKSGIKIIPLPGASSILPALISSNFDIEKFYYYGWLSPKKDVRRKELLNLKRIKETIVLLDTPYRLKAVLSDISKILGSKVNLVVAFQLTMKTEEFLRGEVSKVLEQVEKRNLKGEYVIIINNK